MESNSLLVQSRIKGNLTTHSDEDFISSLPDEVITQILSYLHTKFAVATCVLSKRWKHLWISVPNLDLRSCWFAYSSQFENCVDRVLSVNNVLSVRKIVLECDYSRDHRHDAGRVSAWFKSFGLRDAKKIRICLPYSSLVQNMNITDCSSMDLYLLPDRFFNQNRLVKLKLENLVFKVPPLVCFPCLKTMELEVQFYDGESLTNLLTGCPVLTYLSITLRRWFDEQTLHIHSSSLQTLSLSLHPVHSDDYFDCDVVIDAPKVSYFCLHDWGDTRFDISLSETASIRIDSTYNLSELLRKISHVKELSLGGGLYSYKEPTPEEPLKFHNLTQLTLVIEFSSKLAVVWSHILPYTPNGVNIIFKLIDGDPHFDWCKPLELPDSLISTIESVEITIDDHRKYMTVISCFIKNATTSKTLTFYGFPVNMVNEDEFLKTFLPISKNKERKLNKRYCGVTKKLSSLQT